MGHQWTARQDRVIHMGQDEFFFIQKALSRLGIAANFDFVTNTCEDPRPCKTFLVFLRTQEANYVTLVH